jgi:Amiloride-sensitive sodium channel
MSTETRKQSFFGKICSRTSLHALPDLEQAEGRFKVVWLLVFLGGLGGASVEIYVMLSDFMESPIVTTTSYSSTPSIEFPEVLVCPANPINSSRVAERGMSKEVIDAAKGIVYDNLNWVMSRDDELANSPSGISNTTVDMSLVDLEALFLSIGFDAERVFRKCFFAGQFLDCLQHVHSLYHREYGKCFLFQLDKNQTVAGYGLFLILDLHLEAAWKSAPSHREGAALFIEKVHDPLSNERLLLAPRWYTKISLEAAHYELEETGDGNCRQDMPREVLLGPYTNGLCFSECFQQLMAKRCGCVYSIARKYMIKNLTACWSTEEVSCMRSVETTYAAEFEQCISQCAPPCRYWRYTTTVSYDNFLPSLAPEHPGPGISDGNRSGNNLMAVEIALKEVQYIIIRQFPSVTIHGFISQIGGHLGLFLGASLISLAQFVIMLWEHAWSSARR